MLEKFKSSIEADNFIAVSIDSKEDIWPAFKQLLTVTDKE
jgi:uncharacterized sporulation protein YeaH/YhbH (DUF444 family)